MLNVLEFGVRPGILDDSKLNAAIAAANAAGQQLFFPLGLYPVTPGALTTVEVGVVGQEAFLKAAAAIDAPLLTVQYTNPRAGILNDSPAWLFDFGGFVDATGSSYVGTGLYIKDAYRCKFIIRKAINLKYGVHIDSSWHTGPSVPGSNVPFIVENDFYIKTDSCDVGAQITTGNDDSDNPIDVNTFDMSSSFNHRVACVRVNAGTNSGHSDVHNNTFIFQDLECGQADSDGIVLTGLAIVNQFIIRNQRGINGTGRYGRTNANSGDNLWKVNTWIPDDWDFATNQQVFALHAQTVKDFVIQSPQGRSYYWGPGVDTVVGTNIPSRVGDTIFHVDPGIGDNFGWICTTAGTPGTWTPFGMRSTALLGGTDTNGLTAGATQYFPVSGRIDTNISANNANDLSPVGGMMRNFHARIHVAAGAGKTVTFTLVKNNSLTPIILTISGAADTTVHDTSSMLAVAKGDMFCWEVKDTTGSTNGIICAAGLEILVDP